MTALVAAFEPFDGRRRNRSLDAVRRLAARGVATHTLPVSFSRLPAAVSALLDERPDTLILVGESATAREPVLERVAVNLIDARVPDNDGATPRDQRVVEDGPAAYMATWPARELAEAMTAAGHVVSLSAHAGTFACNAALYLGLHGAASRPAPPRIGFVHVPARWWWANDDHAARVLGFIVERLAAA